MKISTKKSKALVGLDIEAGSVAAAEVGVNGHTAVGKFGIVPLGPGVFREGEVADPEALAHALKQLFAKDKLAKTVRVGLASQRVAVRTLRLPQINDHSELETAVRFQAQDHIPMPLENAVLDWQVVGHSTGENGERQIDVVVVAARRELLGGLMDAVNRAGLRPVGIDLSAFAMVRALARESCEPVEPGDYVDARTPAMTRAGRIWRARPAATLFSTRLARLTPGRLACTATSATSPTSRWLAPIPASSRASRRSVWRGSRKSSPSGGS